jgi:hypothetical protein
VVSGRSPQEFRVHQVVDAAYSVYPLQQPCSFFPPLAISFNGAQERKKYRHFYIGRSQQVGLYTESRSFKALDGFL